MNFFELYQDICQGFSTIIVEDKSFFVKHLTPSEIGYLHDYFEKKKKDYERKGAETRESRLNEINWPEEKEKKKNKMKSQLDSWTLAKTRLVREEQLEEAVKMIAEAQKELDALEREKDFLVGLTSDKMASFALHYEQLRISLFLDKRCKKIAFSTIEDMEDFDSQELISEKFLEKNREFGGDNIRKLSCQPFFMKSFRLCEKPTDFFGKPIYELTDYQASLLEWGGVYKDMIPYAWELEPEDRQDPDKIETAYLAQKNKSNRNEPSLESQIARFEQHKANRG